MPEKPLLSIITVNLNNLEGLKKTMQSVFEQTWQEFEYIIIDGGSNDGSKEFIEEHSGMIDYWVSEPDKGIYNGMNKGIKKCRGNYVVFMNSGDHFLSLNTLQLCYNVIDNNNADVFYGQIKIDENNQAKTITYPKELSLIYLQNMVINHQACFFKLKTLLNFCGYSEKFPLAADYHYYLRAYVSGKKFHPILFPIVKYDVEGTSGVSMHEYKAEMKKIWTDIVPPLLVDLEVKYSSLLTTIKGSLILKVAFKLREYKIKGFHGK